MNVYYYKEQFLSFFCAILFFVSLAEFYLVRAPEFEIKPLFPLYVRIYV